jgi:hypothetical protein
MIKIQGRYSEDNMNTTPGEWTVEEVTELLKNGHRGMLSFMSVFGGYEIEGHTYSASALSVGDDSLIYEKDGKIVVPTYFQRRMLVGYRDSGNPEEKVKVDVVIDAKENPLYITIVKDQEERRA